MEVISVLWKFVAFVFFIFYFIWGLLVLGPRHCRINCVLYDVDVLMYLFFKITVLSLVHFCQMPSWILRSSGFPVTEMAPREKISKP